LIEAEATQRQGVTGKLDGPDEEVLGQPSIPSSGEQPHLKGLITKQLKVAFCN